MKKLLLSVLSTAAIACCLCGSAACGDDANPDSPPPADEHAHSWASGWSKDGAHHWHACDGCDEKKDYGAHDFINDECACGQIYEYANLSFDYVAETNGYSVSLSQAISESSIEIPATYRGKPVTEIAYHAFINASSLTTVTVPDTVKKIGDYAFYGCSNLATVTLPSALEEIGESAFRLCALTEISLPSRVTKIGASAFLQNGALKKISLPDSVTEIGGTAFYGCPVEEAAGSVYAVSQLEKEHLRKVILTSGTELPAGTFSRCDALTQITLPQTLTSIGNSAFWLCSSLQTVELPERLSRIGESAFSFCSALTEIEIPAEVTEIPDSAFENCVKLASVNLPAGIAKIGDAAFSGCALLASLRGNRFAVERDRLASRLERRNLRDCNRSLRRRRHNALKQKTSTVRAKNARTDFL